MLIDFSALHAMPHACRHYYVDYQRHAFCYAATFAMPLPLSRRRHFRWLPSLIRRRSPFYAALH